MAYHSLGDYSKKVAHWAIDNTFPSSPTIATITGTVTWYSYQVGMTHSQEIIRKFILWKVGISGYATAPLVVPWLAPIVSSHFSVGMSCLTSLTLNIISKKIFNPEPETAKQKEITFTTKLPQNIETALSITPKTELSQPIITTPIEITLEEIKIETQFLEISPAIKKEDPLIPTVINTIEEEKPILLQEEQAEKQDVVVIEISDKDDSDDPILLSDCLWKFCS